MADVRQVWDVMAGPLRGASITRDEDGIPCIVRPATTRELVVLISDRHLTPRHADLCQDPVADLIERCPLPSVGSSHLKAI